MRAGGYSLLDGFSIQNRLDCLKHIGRPVGPETYEGAGGGDVHHALVITDVINLPAGGNRFLAGRSGGRSIHMLGDDDTALFNEAAGRFLFRRIIAPGTGIAYAHDRLRRHGADAQEKSGIAGDDLRGSIGTDKAYKRLIRTKGAFIQELTELQTGHHPGNIAGLTDFSVEGMIVFRGAFNADIREGDLAEGNIRLIPGHCNGYVRIHIDKDDPAAGPHQIPEGTFRIPGENVGAEVDFHPVSIGFLQKTLRLDKVGGIRR